MWYELYINKNLDLGIIFDVSLLSKKGNLCNTHFTVQWYIQEIYTIEIINNVTFHVNGSLVVQWNIYLE